MRLSLTAAMLLSAAACITGCTPKTASPSTTTTSEGQKSEASSGTVAAEHNTALVRFVNADSAFPELSVVSGREDRPFDSVSYKKTSAYMEMPRGIVQFKLRAKGNPADLATGRLELFPGRHYTLVALRRKNGDVRLATLSDNLGSLDPGKVRVRLINGSPEIDDLDLFLSGTKSRVLHGSDAGAIVSFTDMEPASVEIRPANRPVTAQLANLNVEANRLYTLIVVGRGSDLDVIQIVDQTGL